jgi:hypothetical protein
VAAITAPAPFGRYAGSVTWKEQLRALVLAGGALGNASPDPCCLHPDMKGCPSDGGAGD